MEQKARTEMSGQSLPIQTRDTRPELSDRLRQGIQGGAEEEEPSQACSDALPWDCTFSSQLQNSQLFLKMWVVDSSNLFSELKLFQAHL